MNSSDYWAQSSFQGYDDQSVGSGTSAQSSHHQVQVQETIPPEELVDSIVNASSTSYHAGEGVPELQLEGESLMAESSGYRFGDHIDGELLRTHNHHHDISGSSVDSNVNNRISTFNSSHRSGTSLHPGGGSSTTSGVASAAAAAAAAQQLSPEQVQRVYYQKGMQELESLQLLDLSPLANWKLSSSKPGFGLLQLREDSPDSFWQSDGSNNGNGNGSNTNNNNGMNQNGNGELNTPHLITIQFSKKVAIERISLFTNFSIDESYTPAKIQILAGSSDGWDLREVCLVSFNKPIGWSHIIFNGIRSDRVLKCFLIKLVVLSNHQDGKDTHLRSVKVFGKKTMKRQGTIGGAGAGLSGNRGLHDSNADSGVHGLGGWNGAGGRVLHGDILRDMSATSGLGSLSGILLNSRQLLLLMMLQLLQLVPIPQGEDSAADGIEPSSEAAIALENVNEIIGYNSGFQSLEMSSISSIR